MISIGKLACYPAIQTWPSRRFNVFFPLWGIFTTALIAVFSAIQATFTDISVWLLVVYIVLELPFIILLAGWVAASLSNRIESRLHHVHQPLSPEEVSTLSELMCAAANKLDNETSDVAKHWAEHFRKSFQLFAIDPIGGASMFRRVFGGMGSYNDWNGVENKSANDEINAIVSYAYILASRLIKHGIENGEDEGVSR